MDDNMKGFYKSYISGEAKFVKRRDTDPKVDCGFGSIPVRWLLKRYLWVSTAVTNEEYRERCRRKRNEKNS